MESDELHELMQLPNTQGFLRTNRVSPRPMMLHALAVIWLAAHPKQDGYIDRNDLQRIGPFSDRAATVLVKANVWELSKGGWRPVGWPVRLADEIMTPTDRGNRHIHIVKPRKVKAG